MHHSYLLKVEGVQQVGHVLATPLSDLLAYDALIPLGCGPLLDKHDVRGVVAVFGEYVATTGPWRDDVSWNTGT